MSQIYVTREAQLSMLIATFSRMREEDVEMAILPIYTPSASAEVAELLREVPQFLRNDPGQTVPEGVVGILDYRDAGEWSVLLVDVMAPGYSQSHTVLVAVKGIVDTSGPNWFDYGLFFLGEALEGRSKSDPPSKHFAPNFASGWDVVRSSQFAEVLRRFRHGREYFVRQDTERRGLNFDY